MSKDQKSKISPTITLAEIQKAAKADGFDLEISKVKRQSDALTILFESKTKVNNENYVATCIIYLQKGLIEMSVLEATMHSPIYQFEHIADLIKGLKLYRELAKNAKGELAEIADAKTDSPDSPKWKAFRNKFLIMLDWKELVRPTVNRSRSKSPVAKGAKAKSPKAKKSKSKK